MELNLVKKLSPKIKFILGDNAVESPRLTYGFSLESRPVNAVRCSFRPGVLKQKNLHKLGKFFEF